MFRPTRLYPVLISLVLLCSFKHPYHLSVTKLGYKKAVKTLGIEVKMFYHDLEPAVNDFAGTQIDIKNHPKTTYRDSLVMVYMKSRFSVKTDGSEKEYSLSGIDFRDEYIHINLLCTGVEGKNLVVSNSMCFEREKTQTNIFHFMVNGKKTTKQTVNPVSEVSFAL